MGSSMDESLLLHFWSCYFSIALRMRYYPLGHLLGAVVTQTGARQGCTLATLLFNLLIQPPPTPILPLLYQQVERFYLFHKETTLNPVHLSGWNEKGIEDFGLFLLRGKTSNNYPKTKVLVFAQNYHKIHNWQINGNASTHL